MFGSLITAIRTLTVLPVPGKDAPRLAGGLPWFPVVGAGLGYALFGLATGADRLLGGTWPEAVGVAVLLGGALSTGGLHLDGVADWADGFFGARGRERTLEVMKDVRVGAFGVTALVSVLLAKWVCLTRLAAGDSLLWIAMAAVVARTAAVALAVALPYARAGGGTGAPFVRDARARHLVLALAAAAGILFLAGRLAGLAALGAGLALAIPLGLWFRIRVRGVTGDLLGATIEITEVAVLFGGPFLDSALH